jgi:diguanylate cyclase (GGDEF)-like protein
MSMRRSAGRRLSRVPLLVLILTLVAIGGVTMLENHADSSRRAEIRVGSLRLALTDLTSAPFQADPGANGTSAPVKARAEIQADEAFLSRGLARTSGLESTPVSTAAAGTALLKVESTVARIFRIASRTEGVHGSAQIPSLQRTLSEDTAPVFTWLEQANRIGADQARLARFEATTGTCLAMLALVGGFLFFYARSEQARRENEKLLDASRLEASTDALTGLGNRRALTDDLTAGVTVSADDSELLVAIFDLNGFKRYNDTFGHGAGDALLARLGARFAAAIDGSGSAYRMGGDEFCLLARCQPSAADRLLTGAAAALSESGEGWSIDSAHGAAWLPSEAKTVSDALRIADQRMYAHKTTLSTLA